MSDLGNATLTTEVDLSGLEAGLRDAQGATQTSLGGVADLAKGALVAGLAGAGVAGMAALASSIGQAGDFEAAVNNLSAVAGDSLSQAGFAFDDVSAKALQLGQDTAFSASQSIAAMTELVKGGVPVADVMGAATDATLNLASAGQLELATAAEIVSKQLGVWGDQGVTATQVTDLLAQAANASTVGVEDLAAGLANAQGTAETAGVEYQDLVQTMALLAPNFASANTAGTSLNNFLLRIQPTTDPAKDAMKELGLMAFNSGNAMTYLRNQGIDPTGMSAMDMKKKLYELSVATGSTAKEAQSFVDAFDQSVFYDAQGNFVGMEQAAELLQGSMEGLSEAEKTQALQTIFGNDAMGAAVALAGAGSEGFGAMGEAMTAAGTAASVAATQNQGWNFAIDSLMGSLETLQIIVGTMLLPVLTALVTDVLTPAVGVVSTLAQALGGSSEAMAALPGPAQAVVAAIQSIIAGFQSGQTATGSWADAFTQAQELIQGVMTAIMGIVGPILAQLSAFWAAHGTEIVAFAKQAWETIGAIIAGILEILQATIIPILTMIGQFISDHSTEIQTVLSMAWSNIQTIITTVLAVIQGVVKTVLAVLKGDWSGAWTEMQGIVSTVIGAIQSIISTTLNAIKSLWSSVLGGMLSTVQTTWENIKTAISDGVQGALDVVAGLADRFAEAGRALIDNLARGIMGRIDSLIEDAKQALKKLSDLLPGSEPRDPTSPLRGLGARGEAFVGNFADPLLASLESLNLRPALAGLGSQLDAAMSGPLGGGAAASATADVSVRLNEGGLRGLIDVQVEKKLNATGRDAATRRRTGG